MSEAGRVDCCVAVADSQSAAESGTARLGCASQWDCQGWSPSGAGITLGAHVNFGVHRRVAVASSPVGADAASAGV